MVIVQAAHDPNPATLQHPRPVTNGPPQDCRYFADPAHHFAETFLVDSTSHLAQLPAMLINGDRSE